MAGEMWAKVIGIILLLGGILGLFGVDFGIGMNTLHAIVWIIAGAVFAWAGFMSGPVEAVNKWLGVILILLGIVGFFALQGLLGLTSTIVGAISAWFGWKG